MKTDVELLELAAKAAGIDLWWSSEPDRPPRIAGDVEFWDPLTDDGDALRLAVKLGICIDTSDGVHITYCIRRGGELVGCPITEYEFDDIYSATRRAIVRAAAAIGEAA